MLSRDWHGLDVSVVAGVVVVVVVGGSAADIVGDGSGDDLRQ